MHRIKYLELQRRPIIQLFFPFRLGLGHLDILSGDLSTLSLWGLNEMMYETAFSAVLFHAKINSQHSQLFMTYEVISSKRGQMVFPIQFYVSVYLLLLACLFFFLSLWDYKPYIREEYESQLNQSTILRGGFN